MMYIVSGSANGPIAVATSVPKALAIAYAYVSPDEEYVSTSRDEHETKVRRTGWVQVHLGARTADIVSHPENVYRDKLFSGV